MQPSISIDYNSRAGLGISAGTLGVGWRIGGMPLIHRCADAAVDNVAAVIEELLNTGIQSIVDGVCTGLLESLMHVADEMPSAKRILGRLGPAATAYCKAWDKLTGKED